MKNKILIILFSVFLTNFGFAQKLVCRDGQVKFLASVPTAIEEVAANNTSVSAVLDSKTGDEIVALFHELNSQGKTIILVTHDDDLALQAKRQIVIKDGQIVS